MQFPFHLSFDNGGCQYPEDCGEPPLPSDAEDRRARCVQLRAVQRGGNNPHQFECCPEKKIVGTGCMNPSCNCKDCQGDCVCATGGEQVEGFSVGVSSCGKKFAHAGKPCGNSNCHCATPCMCGDDCVCNKMEHFEVVSFFQGRDWTFWLASAAIAYIVYHFLMCKSKRK